VWVLTDFAILPIDKVREAAKELSVVHEIPLDKDTLIYAETASHL